MKKRKILLHIGLHKTGSSAIQLALESNRQSLRNLGVLYPESGCHYYWGQHNMAWQLVSHPMYDDSESDWTDFLSEVSDSDTDLIVISSEVFSTYSLKHIKELENVLCDFDVEIIVYLRNQIDWYQSFWCELAKGRQGVPNAPDLDTWVMKSLPPLNTDPYYPAGRNLGNFLALIQNWESVFGSSSVHVKSFEEEIKGDLVKSFLVDLGVKDFGSIELPDRVNDKVDIKKLNLIRKIRSELRDKGISDDVIEGVKAKLMTSDVIRNKETGAYMQKDTVGAIVERFKDMNGVLEKKYFNGRRVLSLDVAEYKSAAIDSYSLEEVSSIVSDLVSSHCSSSVSFRVKNNIESSDSWRKPWLAMARRFLK